MSRSASGGSAFGALRNPQFRLLFTGFLASNIGLWMHEFAVGWLVVQIAIRDGNPALAGLYLGLKSVASALPAVGFGVFAGVFADRQDRRSLLLQTRAASALIALALAAVVITDNASIPAVMLLSAASSGVFAFEPPGRQAMLAGLVSARELVSGMGLLRTSMQVARMLGPVIAGVLVIPVGVGGVLIAKTTLDLASVVLMLRMPPQPPHAAARDIGVLASLREGVFHMGRDDLIRSCAALQLLFALFAIPFSQLLPAVAVETLQGGAPELSWLVASTGVGALVGAFAVASSGAIERRGLVVLGSMLVAGVLLIALGAQRTFLGTLAVLAVLAAMQQLFMGTNAIVLQLAAPEHFRGRVMSLQSVIFLGCSPLGVLAVGALGSAIGVSRAILVAGVVVVIVALLAFTRLRTVRELRARDAAVLTGLAPAGATGAGN